MTLALLRPGNRRRGTREIVQGELCFQSVKVVRNDLTTADVEVVGQSRHGGLSAACRARLLRIWWLAGVRRLKQLTHVLF
jgi:hypothetical protein